MCGICGKLNFDRDAKVSQRQLQAMTNSIAHRGPDDDGSFLSGPVGLGHRRLSIIDLNTGKQPICNEDRSVWIVFNGEIYNYKELQVLLRSRGHKLQTSSDTEVIVHLYEEYGEKCVSHLQGMFSFALWDEKRQLLLLARDRVGIKPLYYCTTREAVLFGSEAKAILADPLVQPEVDTVALNRFLTFRYLPGEQTLFKGIQKLSPGHYLTVQDGKIKIEKYWDLEFSNSRQRRSLDDNSHELNELLGQTVRDHMISDVPVGILLSGGVDSTAVLSYAVESARFPLSTFTVGFNQDGTMDERVSARIAAQRFGTQHYETSITAQGFADFLPSYVWHMEEPVCEPPAIALHYVTKLAREHVKVLLSGEGGDEAFAGYNTYRNIARIERLKSRLGILASGTSLLGRVAGSVSGSARISQYSSRLGMPLEEYYLSRAATPFDLFNQERSALCLEKSVGKHNGGDDLLRNLFKQVSDADTLQKMLYVDTKTWLPDDLLVKADKMTMANSVELRVPFLDHRVLEFAASLPPEQKLKGSQGKLILKHAIAGRVPPEILNRPKTGFPVPYEGWLRNELNSFTRDLLLDTRTTQRGYFEKGAIDKLLDPNASRAYSKEIFSLMVLELWHRTFVDGSSVPAPQLAGVGC